jgi:hypothetical protein
MTKETEPRVLSDAELDHVTGAALTLKGPGKSEPGGSPQSDQFNYYNQHGDKVGKPYP